MTLHDKHPFSVAVLIPLNIAFRTKPNDKTNDLYRERLSDIPMPILERAVQHWIDHGKRYPRVADLRESADLIERARIQRILRLPPGPPSEEPTFACPHCEDTGWRYHEGKFGPPVTIAQANRIGSRAWVKPCSCRETNGVIRARAEQAPRQYYHGEERRR
jgi:hypothetical protein